MSRSYVNIIWKAGNIQNLQKMEGFDKKTKWKTDYTHDWILCEFIPYILYLNIPDNRNSFQRIYKKKLSFEKYKIGYDYHRFGIQSLSLTE